MLLCPPEELEGRSSALMVLQELHPRRDGVVAIQCPLEQLGQVTLDLPDNFLYVFKPLRGAGNWRTLRARVANSE